MTPENFSKLCQLGGLTPESYHTSLNPDLSTQVLDIRASTFLFT